MICADTNIYIEFFKGSQSKVTEALHKAFEDQQLMMNPFVLSELLSSPKLPKDIENYLLAIPRLQIVEDFFERAGFLRRKIYIKGKGVSIEDVYIAQICIDNVIPILTYDQDLMMISENSSLKVIFVH